MNVVIYARYSSHSQTEQSIEGQLQVCYEYAKSNGHIVIGEYIDRAQSGTTDSRADFQRMIADSDRHTFEAVLVYQLDRFARNRYDAAIYSRVIKQRGARLVCVAQDFGDGPEAVILEALMQGMAEYYSLNLATEVCVSGCINNVYFCVFIVYGCVLCKNCNSTLTFNGVGVHNSVLHNLIVAENTALTKHLVN